VGPLRDVSPTVPGGRIGARGGPGRGSARDHFPDSVGPGWPRSGWGTSAKPRAAIGPGCGGNPTRKNDRELSRGALERAKGTFPPRDRKTPWGPPGWGGTGTTADRAGRGPVGSGKFSPRGPRGGPPGKRGSQGHEHRGSGRFGPDGGPAGLLLPIVRDQFGPPLTQTAGAGGGTRAKTVREGPAPFLGTWAGGGMVNPAPPSTVLGAPFRGGIPRAPQRLADPCGRRCNTEARRGNRSARVVGAGGKLVSGSSALRRGIWPGDVPRLPAPNQGVPDPRLEEIGRGGAGGGHRRTRNSDWCVTRMFLRRGRGMGLGVRGTSGMALRSFIAGGGPREVLGAFLSGGWCPRAGGGDGRRGITASAGGVEV